MKRILFVLLSFGVLLSWSQTPSTISGTISNAIQKDIRLIGFNGINDTLFSETITNASGHFVLSHPENYRGASLLQIKEVSSVALLLNHESFSLQWNDLKDFTGLRFSNSKENEWFQQAYLVNNEAQKKLLGLQYLLALYKNESLKKEWVRSLEKEINVQSNSSDVFNKKIPTTSFAASYIYYRTLIQELQKENKNIEEALKLDNTITTLDYGNADLFHSGLVKEILDGYLKHILKINNKETIIHKINAFSNQIKKTTLTRSRLLNQYSSYLTKEYEKYGLIEAAEYIALSLIDDSRCFLDSKTIPLLQQYKKMVVGNVAFDIVFHNNSQYKDLKELKATYKVVVFGASWCEACKSELLQLAEYTRIFKEKYDAEIVFVSLDTNEDAYINYVTNFNFITDCDYKGWEGTNVKNYYVYASPSFFILDNENKILAKPDTAISVAKWLSENNEN